MTAPIGEITAEWAKESGLRHYYFPEIDSTNDYAKTLDLEPEQRFVLVLADHQKHGRGRGENTWTDHAHGQYLLSSWVFIFDQPVQHIASPLLGLALFLACARTWPQLPWSVKAPNDLWLGDKKVGGLLTEIITNGDRHQVIVGLGLNVLDHPHEIASATHVSELEQNVMERWPIFLGHLLMEFHQALMKALRPTLDNQARMQLMAALNRNPTLSEPFVDVDKHANLRAANVVIPWTRL